MWCEKSWWGGGRGLILFFIFGELHFFFDLLLKQKKRSRTKNPKGSTKTAKQNMLSYISSWLYDVPEKADPVTMDSPAHVKTDSLAAGLARYANPDNPKAPSSFISELATKKLRRVELPARPTHFPPRHPVLQQILAKRKRID